MVKTSDSESKNLDNIPILPRVIKVFAIMSDIFCAIGQAAKILGVCIKTMRRYDKAGTIKAFRTVKKKSNFA